MTKRIVGFVIALALSVLLCAGGYILIWGMPVSGAPNPKDVQSVSVKYGEEPGGAAEYTDPEKIKSACGLLSSLNYDPFADASEDGEIAVTRKVAAANDGTCWWRGKALAIKQEGEFVSIAKGLFPQD